MREKAATQCRGKAAREQCLCHARHAFDQHVAACGDGDKQALDRGRLSVNHSLQLGLHGAPDIQHVDGDCSSLMVVIL